MARARVGGSSGAAPQQTSDYALSGYGKTKLNSAGYTANNPYSRTATQAAKTYTPKAAYQSNKALAYGTDS